MTRVIVRVSDIGADGRFRTAAEAISFHDALGLRVVNHDAYALTFEAVPTATAKPTRTPKAPVERRRQRVYKTDVCAICGGARDEALKRARCKDCYKAEKKAQYERKKGRAA